MGLASCHPWGTCLLCTLLGLIIAYCLAMQGITWEAADVPQHYLTQLRTSTSLQWYGTIRSTIKQRFLHSAITSYITREHT